MLRRLGRRPRLMGGRSAWAAVAITAAAAFLAVAPASAVTRKSGPLSYVTASIPAPAGSNHQIQPSCPGTKRITGGGGAFTSSTEDLNVSSLFPVDLGDPDNDPDDAYTARFANESGSARGARATAICLGKGKDALDYGSTTSQQSGNTTSAGTASCPASGRLTGAGLLLANADYSLVQVEELAPGLDGRKVVPGTLRWGSGNSGPIVNRTVSTICLAPGAGKLRYPYKAAVLFAGVSTLKVRCPGKSRVLGGGFSRFPTDLLASEPFDAKDKGKAPDDGWRVRMRSLSPIAGFAYAFCLAP